MSKKKKRSKKKPTAPPLSRLDKAIYKIGYAVIAFFSILLFVSIFSLFEKTALSDEFVMASSASMMPMVFPFVIYVILSVLFFWNGAHTSRKPIFGDPNVIYGKESYQTVYPLFSKERKKQWIRPSAEKHRRKMRILWLSGLLFCLFLACFSMFGRVSLMQNGDITIYNAVGRETELYSVRDVDELEIRAECIIRRGRRHGRRKNWRICFEFTMTDGCDHEFNVGDFRSREEAFEHMLKMKNLIESRKITITGVENLEKVIDDHNYTPEEIELLYELFEVASE
jgi:hypothetical protein